MAPQTKPKLIGLVVVALLVAAGTGTVIWMNRDDSSPTHDMATMDTPSSTAVTPSNPVASDSTYKDGIYSADGSYRSPGGNEMIGVKLTIANNVITDVAITTYGATGESQQHQEEFKSGISAIVVGKKVNEVKVSRVSGSSLTSTGFNNALETIKSEAKV